ncbi:MAG TPA: PAS domain-containing protein [Coleofasciculaceae cyanobacterium]
MYEQQIQFGDQMQYEEVRVICCGENEVLFMIRDTSKQQAALHERKQAEDALHQLNQELEARVEQRTAALRESEERWQLALRGSNASLWDWNLRTHEIFYSSRWKELRGLSDDEVNTAVEEWNERIHPDDRDRVLSAFADHLAQKTAFYQEEYRIQHKDDTYIWILDRGQALWDEMGTPVRMIGSEMDISRRKQAELEAQLLRERLQFVLSSSPAVILTCQPYGNCAPTFISDNIVTLSGYTAEEFLSDADFWARHIHPQDAPQIFAGLPTLFEQGHHIHEYRFLHKAGHYLWVRNELRLIRDEQDRPIEIVGYLADISEQQAALRERKYAEEQLCKSEAHLSAAQRIAHLGSWEFNLQTNEIFWSQENYQIFGRNLDRGNLTYEEFRQYIHPDDLPQVERAIQSVIKSKQPFEAEYRLYRPDGSLRYVSSRAEPLLDEVGQPVSLVGTILDISDRKQLELNLKTSQAKLVNVLNSANAGIIESRLFANRDFEYNYCSQGCETVFGYTQPELMADKTLWKSRVLPEDIPLIAAWIDNILADRPSATYDYRFFHKDGRLQWVSSTYTAYRETEDVWLVTAVHVDVTKRKLAEAALEQKTEELDRFFSVALDLFCISDIQGQFRRLNPQWEVTLKYSLDELEGQPFINFVHPDDVEATLQTAKFIRQNKSVLGFINRYRCKDGSYRWIEWRSTPFGNAIYSLARDITDRKQAEDTLRQQEEKLQNLVKELTVAEEELRSQMNELLKAQKIIQLERSRYQDLFNSAPDAYIVTDVTGTILKVNQMAEQLLGYSKTYLDSHQLLNFVSQESWRLLKERIDQLKKQTSPQSFQIHLQSSKQEKIPVAVRVVVLSDPQGTKSLRWILRNISREQQAASQLQELSDRLTLAIRSGAIGIWEWDILQDVLIWDDRMYELYGIQRSNFSNAYEAWINGVHPDDRSVANDAIQQALAGQKEFDIEFRVIYPDQTIHFIKAYGLVQRSGKNKPKRMIGINFDISDRKQAEAQLQQINERLSLTNAKLDRATRLKDEFLANMSHELRTPLNAILGMSEGLQEGVFSALNDRQTRAVATIERSGKHLLELINDILDLSKIEADKLELQTAPVAIRYLCKSSLTFVEQQAISKNIQLTVEGLQRLPDIVVDERRIRQVLINLLSNAIKFTPEGGKVKLMVQAEQQNSEHFLKLSILDTGIGIAQADIAKLFQPFVQIDSSLSRQYTGTGLGLVLVRQFTELHGGTVSVTSQLEQGSCFTICLPYLTEASIDLPMLPTSQVISLDSDNTRVLVIDDSNTAAEHVSRYLAEQEMQAIVYASGEGAIDEVLRVEPALIILDILLPRLSGWDVLRQLKAHPKTRQIPVIVVSVVDERSKALSLGAVESLVKPINREHLQHTLERLQNPHHDALSRELLITFPESASEPILSPLILLAEDNIMNVMTISSYLGEIGYRMIYAKNGQEAVEMTQNQEPDLILMDIQMPGMDGLEGMRLIRNNPRFANLPIIALTALAMPDDNERCLDAGANRYMTKPVKLRQLKEVIQQLLLEEKSL